MAPRDHVEMLAIGATVLAGVVVATAVGVSRVRAAVAQSASFDAGSGIDPRTIEAARRLLHIGDGAR